MEFASRLSPVPADDALYSPVTVDSSFEDLCLNLATLRASADKLNVMTVDRFRRLLFGGSRNGSGHQRYRTDVK